MLNYTEAHHIRSDLLWLTKKELRSRVLRNEWIRGELQRVGPAATEEDLIYSRMQILIKRLVDNRISRKERKEFVELQTILGELMIPERLRRRWSGPHRKGTNDFEA
jgi:hypothetical protein